VYAQPSQSHAGVFEARIRSSKLRSTLEKLNIQPLHVPAEARELPNSSVPPAAADFHIPHVATWGQHPFLMSSCEAEAAPLRVAVLVSGGVDSSLALKLVKAAGHQATAFYLQIWFQEDFRNFWDACPWEEDLSYAQQVCEALGVPLVVVPLTEQYWDRVVSHSVAEIKQGRTPNPDMLCNSR
jgi:tRNA-specific 2-thiouridylase